MELWFVFRRNLSGTEFIGRVFADTSLEACTTVARNRKQSAAGMYATRQALTKLEIQAQQNKESKE